MIGNYAQYCNLSMKFGSAIEIVARFRPRLDRLGDEHICIIVHHHYVFALLSSARYREADTAQTKLSAMAERLENPRSLAYALATALHLSTLIAPKPIETFEALSFQAKSAAASGGEASLQIYLGWVVGWDEVHRGRIGKALESAEELLAVGRQKNDPRALGYGMWLRAWIAMLSDDYETALSLAETAIAAARTPHDRASGMNGKIVALALLRRPGSFQMLGEWIDQCTVNQWNFLLPGVEGIRGVALVVHGEIGDGINWMERYIVKREHEGYRAAAEWYRMFLCQIFLEIISGTEKPAPMVLVRNMLTLATVMFTARKRIISLIKRVRQNNQLDPNGFHIARCEMILGLLYKINEKTKDIAARHLLEARRMCAQFGPTPMLTRIDLALSDLE